VSKEAKDKCVFVGEPAELTLLSFPLRVSVKLAGYGWTAACFAFELAPAAAGNVAGVTNSLFSSL
jgi:hypothetical protein